MLIKSSRSVWIVAAAALLVLVGGFPGDEASSEAQQMESRFSGETIINGLVFGQGEVAEKFPEIWGRDLVQRSLAANADRLREHRSRIVSFIEEEQPEFIREFARNVQSGNPERVQSALRRYSELHLEALKAIDLLPRETLVPGSVADNNVAVAVVAVEVGAAVTVVAVIDFTPLRPPPLEPGTLARLEHEMYMPQERFVGMVTERLAVR